MVRTLTLEDRRKIELIWRRNDSIVKIAAAQRRTLNRRRQSKHPGYLMSAAEVFCNNVNGENNMKKLISLTLAVLMV